MNFLRFWGNYSVGYEEKKLVWNLKSFINIFNRGNRKTQKNTKRRRTPKTWTAESFKAYSQEQYVVFETLSSEHKVHGIKVVKSLKADAAMNKIKCFWDFLKESGTHGAGCRTLSDLIAFMREAEITREIERKVSVIFDGTVRMGKGMFSIICFMDDDG